MTVGSYTPGPWTFNGNDSPPGLRGTITAEAQAWDESGRTRALVARLPGTQGVTQESVQADARLIAAAPDLLEAAKFLLTCEEAVNETERQWIVREALAHFRAAIAKAEGV